MASQDTINKAITRGDDEYLQKLVSARTEVIIAISEEQQTKKNYEDKKKNSINKQLELIQLAERRYTIHYIDEMIEESTELYVEERLQEIRTELVAKKMMYSYDIVEKLMTYDKFLEKNQPINSDDKYQKSKIKRLGEWLFTV